MTPARDEPLEEQAVRAQTISGYVRNGTLFPQVYRAAAPEAPALPQAASSAVPRPNAHRQSAVGQKAGIGISGPAFCPRLSAFVTWNGGPNSNIRSCVVEGRNPEY